MIIARNKTLVIDGEDAIKVLAALNSDTRLLMLSLLSHRAMNMSALTEALGLPHSTVAFNLKQLEETRSKLRNARIDALVIKVGE